MNERIRELWAQCVIKHTKTPMNWQDVADEFAELIVRECINCCDEVDRINEAFIQDYDYDPQNGPKECIQVIKEHFGVEE
jgi:hypothetical protein